MVKQSQACSKASLHGFVSPHTIGGILLHTHQTPLGELIRMHATSPDQGLSDAQVMQAREKYGENKLAESKRKTNIRRFFDQFRDVMIVVLLIAAGVSFVVALHEGHMAGFFEPLLILLIVVLNAIMGVMQENKAEKALEALQSMSAPRARVVRGGKESIIPAAELVPGDIIHLEAGDFVPADARLLRSFSLKAEEAALTGESVPAEKDAEAEPEENAPLGDRVNMVFSGCSITYGTALAVVTATGMDTEMGKIAGLLAGEGDMQTPLQQKLAKMGQYLGMLALAACAVIFVIGLLEGMPVLSVFMIAVSLAVSAIPEGLPAIVTIVLSIGVQRMVKHNAIIRRLPAVETLGSASVICSDKTGTLTQNRMTLVSAWVSGQAETEEITEENTEQVRQLLRIGALCCDGAVNVQGDEVQHIGDPTETAIVLAAHRNGMPKEALNQEFPRLFSLPFDSVRKRMSTINRIGDRQLVIVKGAFDSIADRCVNGDLTRAAEITDAMSRKALRVLALAYKEISAVPEDPNADTLESGLTLLGLVGMIDPPRPEARDAVQVCRGAGIRPVMITGDHIATASAIARDLGILAEGGTAITGSELGAMDDDTLAEEVEHISVYARVSPEDKIRIVKAWQKRGHVVSMTGDGVNDAPALKAADIGCAMGITGTDVAKGAADMTLTDDNFATIIEAVREGRGIYDNIRKVVTFLLGTNIGEVLTVFFALVFWRQTPLLPLHLLWINLVTDSLPAIALGMEAVEEDVMQRPPRHRDEGIFAHGLFVRVVLQGCMFAALTLIAFSLGRSQAGLVGGQTMAFIVLALSQIVQAFNMRSMHSLFHLGPFTNRTLNIAAAISAGLMVLVVLTPVSAVFGLAALTPMLYLQALALALFPLLAIELAKAFGRRRSSI